ncbi:MAG: tyrosine-type recombinase/integrase [Gammaproteobacteria bacterium]|nr:tyrosine-type recombinase/integrase [Gammaproteobacteria bacterium]
MEIEANMGVFDVFTKYLLGKRGIVEDSELIVDGVICGRDDSDLPSISDNTVIPDTSELTYVSNCVDNKARSSDPPKKDAKTAEEIVKKTEKWELPSEYVEFMRAEGKSERTISEYCYDLKSFGEKYHLDHIELHELEGCLNGLNSSTARRRVSALKTFSKWRGSEGATHLLLILAQLKLPKPTKRTPGHFGHETFTDLVSRSKRLCVDDDRRGLWLGLMVCCGLRTGEIHIAESSGSDTIRVPGSKDSGRSIPAPSWLIDCMKRIPPEKWRLTREYIWRVMKSIGVPKPKNIRHSYAKELLRNGYQLKEVQRLLGHSNIGTTLAYTHSSTPMDVNEKLNLE